MNLTTAIDAAARTQWEAWTTAAYPVVPVRRWDHLSDTERDDVRVLVRPIVEAAAPWIAQDTLRDVAGRYRDKAEALSGTPGYGDRTLYHVAFGTIHDLADGLDRDADEIQAVTR